MGYYILQFPQKQRSEQQLRDAAPRATDERELTRDEQTRAKGVDDLMKLNHPYAPTEIELADGAKGLVFKADERDSIKAFLQHANATVLAGPLTARELRAARKRPTPRHPAWKGGRR